MEHDCFFYLHVSMDFMDLWKIKKQLRELKYRKMSKIILYALKWIDKKTMVGLEIEPRTFSTTHIRKQRSDHPSLSLAHTFYIYPGSVRMFYRLELDLSSLSMKHKYWLRNYWWWSFMSHRRKGAQIKSVCYIWTFLYWTNKTYILTISPL